MRFTLQSLFTGLGSTIENVEKKKVFCSSGERCMDLMQFEHRLGQNTSPEIKTKTTAKFNCGLYTTIYHKYRDRIVCVVLYN